MRQADFKLISYVTESLQFFLQEADGVSLIYIDRHLVHEAFAPVWQLHVLFFRQSGGCEDGVNCFARKVTSPQAFEGLRMSSREADHITNWLKQGFVRKQGNTPVSKDFLRQ